MASAFFSLIDSIGETFEGVVENVENVVGTVEKEVEDAVQQMDAGVDLDDVLEEIQLAADEAALLEAYRRLEVLARSQAAAILHGWVVEDRVVPVVCAALCRVESAKLAAAPLARTLNGMGRALDSTGTTAEEMSAFHEQIVRRTENGKAMLKLLQATDPASRTQSLALLRRVYPQTSKVLGRHLLSDPQSISALMQILQDAGGSSWADAAEEAALCAECVSFLRLVTAEDGDVRMIITFQDGAEALLAIATQALSAASGALAGSPDSASAFLGLAGDACVCVQQLVGQGAVAQKYMREAGHLTAVTRTLRCVLGALALQAQGSAWTSGLQAAAAVLLDTLAAFVSKAGSEAASNSKALVQSAGLLEMLCQEVLPCPPLGPLRLRAVEVLAEALAVAPEPALAQSLTAAPRDRSALDVLVAVLLGLEATVPSVPEVSTAIEALLAGAVEKSSDVRQALLRPCWEQGSAPTAAGFLLVGALRAADRRDGRSQVLPATKDWWPANADTWFAARLLEACLGSGGAELRISLAEPRTVAGEQVAGLLSEVLGPLAGLARAWRSQGEQAGVAGDASASLCALLQLVAEWCHGCDAAAKVVARSPAQLPELVSLLEMSNVSPAAVHVRGLAALLLGTCLLELPSQEDAALVSQGQLMEILASRVGVDTFTRAAEDFQRSLGGCEKPVLGAMRRYPAGFQAATTARFQHVQEAMVRIWLERGAGGSGGGPAASGLAEDVAEHFKDLIKMQDKELRSLRAEVAQLREENSELQKLTTDEDKTLLLWKVRALTKQSEALQAQCDLLQASRGSVEVARLRERQLHRAQRQELEQQLQVLVLAVDEAESQRERPVPDEKEGSDEPGSVAAERDELLSVLSQIHRECPEAQAFLAPLGFAPLLDDREVTVWEAAAVRLGHQAELLALACPAPKATANGWHGQPEAAQEHIPPVGGSAAPEHRAQWAEPGGGDEVPARSLQAQESFAPHAQQAQEVRQEQHVEPDPQASATEAQKQVPHQAQVQVWEEHSHQQVPSTQKAHQMPADLPAQLSEEQPALNAQQQAEKQQQQAERQAQQQALQAQQEAQLLAEQHAQQQALHAQQQAQLQAERQAKLQAEQQQQQAEWQAQQQALQAQQEAQLLAEQHAQQQAQQEAQLQAERQAKLPAEQQQQQAERQAQQPALQAQQEAQLQAEQHAQQQALQAQQEAQLQAERLAKLQAEQQQQQAERQAQQQALQAQREAQLQAEQHAQLQALHAQQQAQAQQQVQAQQEAQLQAQQQEQQARVQQQAQQENGYVDGTAPWALPAGWAAYSTQEGHIFYYHQGTGTSQWEKPFA